MKIPFIFSLLLVLTNCQKAIELPNNAKLTAKYVVFEDSISSKIIKDLKKVKEFDKKNEDYKQPFKLDGKIYEFETEYKLGSNDSLKHLIEHVFHSFKYSDFGMKKYSWNKEAKRTLGLRFFLKFSDSREEIIDSKDTLEIDKVYLKEKLIFVKPQRNDGRVNIYEYK